MSLRKINRFLMGRIKKLVQGTGIQLEISKLKEKKMFYGLG